MALLTSEPHRYPRNPTTPRDSYGPSAWFANEQDATTWRRTVDRGAVDYSHVFLTRARYREVRQSNVTLQEVLDGLAPDDRRLHDEIVVLWMDRSPSVSPSPDST